MSEERQRKLIREHIGNTIGSLLDQPTAACLFLALVILTLMGVGNVAKVGMLGLLLCLAGLRQQSAAVDLWIFLPLLLYNIINMASSYAMFGRITVGYGASQIIFPLLYLLAATLSDREYLLLRRLCAVWVGVVAVHGIWTFAYRALTTGARRLSGLPGGPNAIGIFLVIGWFALIGAAPAESEKPGWAVCLRHLEPVILIALSLTLSLGSFLSLATGMAVLILLEKKRGSWKTAVRFACRMLARASLCMGTGILTYVAASRTDAPWFCLLILAYGGALAACWPDLLRFLENRPKMAAGISGMGVLVAGTAVAMRPSSIATFAERLAMMRNGLGYLFDNPLLGVGPYQWRALNLRDDDKYFNTNHIHNVLIHVGVEIGLIAMAMLIVIAVRYWCKRHSPEQRGGFAAFFFHCMIDTGFFYLGITGLMILTAGDARQNGRKMGLWPLRCILAAFAMLFVYNVIRVRWR